MSSLNILEIFSTSGVPRAAAVGGGGGGSGGASPRNFFDHAHQTIANAGKRPFAKFV